MREENTLPSNQDVEQLSEEEATELASELKAQLLAGRIAEADSELIQRMVAGLGDQRGALRLTFAKSLGAVGQAAIPTLCKAMKSHKSVTVRRAAAKTLNLIGDPKALPDLLEAFLNDSDPVVQGSSAGAMATIGPEAVDALLNILVNPNCTPFQVGLVNLGLAFIGAKAPEALREAARSEHAEIRVAAISALGDQIQSLGDQEAKTLVVEALDDPCSEVRAEASTLLGKLHDPDGAMPLLTPKLRDEVAQVRKNAALSLMKLQATDAIEAIKEAATSEEDSSVKGVFTLSINQLSKSN
ncbi:MAG: HEAT repeat domain-containing protein [Prochlorococcus sp.]|nr:HEAT repeat domain-containing protein [Prochlorococcaceae cyanobacterium Fu_MAG_50]